MTELISKEAQAIYQNFMNNRVEYVDFHNRDNRALTAANSKFIRRFSRLEDVQIRKFTGNNVKLEEILVPNAREDKYIYYIHGGGFVTGEPAWGYYYAVEVAKQTRRRIVAVDYRLAPEHPFPAGIEDCIAGYEWMLQDGARPEDTVFLGESAGGNLVLALTVACKQRGIPMPAALTCVSPVADATFPFPSYASRNERDCILPKNQADDTRENYLVNGGGEDVLASPYLADVTGFPPTYHVVATEEMLFDDSIKMHEKLLKAGVDARLRVWEGLFHTFVMLEMPESWQCIGDIAGFFNEVNR